MQYNKTLLAGNLTSDWELRFTASGKAVAKNSIANNRTWKSESGEKKEAVTFVPLEAWGKLAEVLSEHTGKGDPLFIEGRIEQESWEDKTTHQQRSKLKVVIESFSFVGKKEGGTRQTAPKTEKPAGEAKPNGDKEDEDSIPF